MVLDLLFTTIAVLFSLYWDCNNVSVIYSMYSPVCAQVFIDSMLKV